MNIFRKLLIAALEHNCGYSDTRRNRYALAWNVKLYRVDASFEAVCDKLKKENPRAARLAPYLHEAGLIMWDEQAEFDWAMGDAREQIDAPTQGTHYAMLSPKTAARFGIQYHSSMRPMREKYRRRTTEQTYYPALLPHWIRVKPYTDDMNFDVSYGFAGRSGGYIVMTEFEKHGLCVSNDQLIEWLRAEESSYSNKWCRKLCAMIYECDQMFTTQKAAAEIMYQMAYRLGRNVEEWQEERTAFKAERRERRYWESRDVVTA